MNIAVILKQVPDTEAKVLPDPSNPAKINEDDIKFILNPYDEYAVEEALKITEDKGGEVIGVCIGPERSETAIRSALAMGAHRAVLITDPEAIEADIITQSKILAEVIKTLDVSLILCGKEFIDTQEDAVAPAIAEALDMPHVTNASKIDFIDDNHLEITREIEGGTLKIETPLPVVISCPKGLNEPRYPTLIAIKRSKRKEIKKMSLQDIGFTPDSPKQKIIKLETPPQRTSGKKVTGEPQEVVAECLNWLAQEAKII